MDSIIQDALISGSVLSDHATGLFNLKVRISQGNMVLENQIKLSSQAGLRTIFVTQNCYYEYEYEIDFFSILVCSLPIIRSHTHLIL